MRNVFLISILLSGYFGFCQSSWERLHSPISRHDIIYVDHFTNGKSIAISTNEYLESFDGGKTWQILHQFKNESNAAASWIRQVSVINSTIVAFSGPAIHLSNDDGATWNYLPTGATGYDSKFFMQDEQTFYVADGYNYYISKNGGSTWSKKAFPNNTKVMEFYFSSPNVGFALFRDGSILKTVNGGNEWKLKIKLQETSVSHTAVSFFNPNIGILSSNGKVLITKNGGENWQVTGTLRKDFSQVVYFSQDQFMYVSAGEYYRGVTFNDLSNGSSEAFYTDPYSNNSIINSVDYAKGVGYIVGGSDGHIATSQDGKEWKRSYFFNNDFDDFTIFDDGTGYVISKNRLYKTFDGAISWELIKTSLLDPFGNSNHTVDAISFYDERSGFAVLSNRRIVKTSDGGLTWSNYYYSQMGTIESIFAAAANHCFSSTQYGAGAIILPRDDGQTFERHEGLSFNMMRWVNADLGFGIKQGKLYRSKNSGAAWELILAEAGVEFNSLQFINESTGYAGSDKGKLWKSLNGGDSWVSVHDFKNRSVLDIEFIDKDYGFVSAIGGTYLTKNGGEDFNKILYANTNLETAGDYLYGGGSEISRKMISLLDFDLTVNQTTCQSSTNAALSGAATGLLIETESLVFEYSSNGLDFEQYETAEVVSTADAITQVSANLDGLEPDTTYYYRLKGTVAGSDFFSRVRSFKTDAAMEIMVENVTAKDKSITLRYKVISSDQVIRSLSINYATLSDNSDVSSQVVSEEFSPNQSILTETTLNNLKPETTYYLHVTGEVNGILIKSNTLKHKTFKSILFDITSQNKGANSLEVKGELSVFYTDATNISLEYGIDSFDQSVTSSINRINAPGMEGLLFKLENLENNKIYKMRVKAELNGVLEYSDIENFSLELDPWLIKGENDFGEQGSPVLQMVGYTKNFSLSKFAINYGTDLNLEEQIIFDSDVQAAGSSTFSRSFNLFGINPSLEYYYQFEAVEPLSEDVIKSPIYSFKQESTLGVSEGLKYDDFRAYPNPFDSSINLDFKDNSFKEVYLFDLQGRLILKKRSQQDKLIIDTESLSSGLYILNIRDYNGNIKTLKLKK